jgi:DNA-binding CsgD family transcriptional regulator
VICIDAGQSIAPTSLTRKRSEVEILYRPRNEDAASSCFRLHPSLGTSEPHDPIPCVGRDAYDGRSPGATGERALVVTKDSILGREEELATIARFMGDDRSGFRALLLEGEAGIGKTTLWREALRLARGKGLVLTSRAAQVETRLSFAVLGDLLSPAFEGVLEELPPSQRGALEAALLLGPTRSRPDARAVSLAVLGVLRSLASAGPVTIAIDDVQWTDTPSARALAFALRRLDDGSISVVAARRVAPGLADPLDLAGLAPYVHVLTLGPITPTTLGRLLGERLGRPFGSPLVKRIHEGSGGNPFFAIEIGRALGSDEPNPRPGEPLPVPMNLQDLLGRRLSALSASASRALLIAACSSLPTPALLEDAGAERSGLEEAEEAGIVELREEAIRFTHPLLASAVYAGASSRKLRDVHALLAHIATDPEERARHLALSIVSPNEAAAAALEHAAQQAEARGAPAAASELYQLAATVTPPEMIERLLRLRHGVVGNLWAAGDIVGARDLQQRLFEQLEPGPGRAHTLYRMASVSWNDVTRVTGLLTRALDEVGDDHLTHAHILTELAWAALWACDPPASTSWADAALEIAEGLDEPLPLRTALAIKAMAAGVLGHDTNDLLEYGISLEGALWYNELSTSRTCLGRLQTWAGALDSARGTLEIELDRRLEAGYETLTWEVRADLAEVEYRAGRWQLAGKHVGLAHEIVTDAGLSGVLGEILPLKASVACATGETVQARIDGAEALAMCERMGDRWDEILARSALGFLELSLGDHAACHAWLDALVGLTEAMGLREPGAFPFVPDEVEALVVLGELVAAERLTDRLEEQGEALRRPLALATAARCRGLIAGARGDLAEAAEHLQRALSFHGSVPQPFELGRTLLVVGVVHRRMRQKRSARELLQESLDLFVQLGAPLWAAKAKSELARIGGRASTPSQLTGTEQRVAELAAEGSTNREIADRLFISVKTVEANLSRTYHKLGIGSRRELGSTLGTLDRTDEQT